MELTKEVVENCANAHTHMLMKAEHIWDELLKLGYKDCEYFTNVDNLSFNHDGTVYASGWDGSGSCGASFPLRFFYEENWLEEVTKEAEERAEQKRIKKEETLKRMDESRERKEKEEYERLKKKFG